MELLDSFNVEKIKKEFRLYIYIYIFFLSVYKYNIVCCIKMCVISKSEKFSSGLKSQYAFAG